MRRFFGYTILSVIFFQFSGCSTQMRTANGSYGDFSFTCTEQKYSVVRLKEVKATGKAIFGIPIKSSEKQRGFIYRFNGINLNEANGFLPTLTMIGMSLAGGVALDYIVGDKEIIVDGQKEYVRRLGIPLSTVITIPIAGIANNLLWPSSSYQVAAFNLNNRLVSDNPDIDVFLNPKYEITRRFRLWDQQTIINTNVMGAIIKPDSICPEVEDELNLISQAKIQKSTSIFIEDNNQKPNSEILRNNSKNQIRSEDDLMKKTLSAEKKRQEELRADSIRNEANKKLFESFTKKYKVGDDIKYYSEDSVYPKTGKIIKIDSEYVTFQSEENNQLLKMTLKAAMNLKW